MSSGLGDLGALLGVMASIFTEVNLFSKVHADSSSKKESKDRFALRGGARGWGFKVGFTGVDSMV